MAAQGRFPNEGSKKLIEYLGHTISYIRHREIGGYI